MRRGAPPGAFGSGSALLREAEVDACAAVALTVGPAVPVKTGDCAAHGREADAGAGELIGGVQPLERRVSAVKRMSAGVSPALNFQALPRRFWTTISQR
jgi:hypothetical protein